MPDQHDLPEGIGYFEQALCECSKALLENLDRAVEADDGTLICPDCETPYESVRMVQVADLPAIRAAAVEEERERREVLIQHVAEWAFWACGKAATDEGMTELRHLIAAVNSPADTDDLCTCGHVRHEHHTWNEWASVGCAFCSCEQFHLDLAALDQEDDHG